MSLERKNNQRRKRRCLRVRSRLNRGAHPRVSVFRSNSNFYGQIIDDINGKTLASCSTLELKLSGTKSEKAKLVGVELAKKAIKEGVSKVILDRGKFLYHGRVKAFAEGLREAGLQL